jgi:hypothetical protein
MNCWVRDKRKWEVHLLRQNMRLRQEDSNCHDNSNMNQRIFSANVRLFWVYGQTISYSVHFSAWKKLQVYALTMMPACGGSDGCVCVRVSQSFQILNQLTDFHKTMYECDDTWGYLHITLLNCVHSNAAKYVILWGVSGTELRVLKWSIIDLKKLCKLY